MVVAHADIISIAIATTKIKEKILDCRSLFM
jgi:hypothetical protein